MEQWEIIRNNPKFQSAFGNQVTGDPNQWWSNLDQETKDSFVSLYGNPQANIADPILEYTSGLAATPNNNTNQGVLTGYEDYGPNDFLAEATGENAANRVSQEDYMMNELLPPVEGRGMFNMANTGVLGTLPNNRSDAQYANMSQEALQQLADAGNPTAQAMLRANVRQPFEGPVLKTNNMDAPAANVPNVDFADPTMVPPVQGPVLIDTSKPNNETTTGVLGGTTGTAAGGPSVRSIMSSSGPKTSNRRGSDMPNMLIDRNEALIRIGGAMYSGGLQGDGLGAATREYGAIQDANRKTALEKYKTDQATKLAMAKAASKGKKGDDDTIKAINDTNMQMDSYQRALQAIADSRAAGGNLTGVGGMFKSFLDNFTGDEDGARRLILKKVKVDDALLRVAHTKGAISNAEMKLFLSPAPKDWQDEKIWESWLLERVDALEKVQARLRTGQEVPDDMKGPNVAATRASMASEPDAEGFTIKETTQK